MALVGVERMEFDVWEGNEVERRPLARSAHDNGCGHEAEEEVRTNISPSRMPNSYNVRASESGSSASVVAGGDDDSVGERAEGSGGDAGVSFFSFWRSTAFFSFVVVVGVVFFFFADGTSSGVVRSPPFACMGIEFAPGLRDGEVGKGFGNIARTRFAKAASAAPAA